MTSLDLVRSRRDNGKTRAARHRRKYPRPVHPTLLIPLARRQGHTVIGTVQEASKMFAKLPAPSFVTQLQLKSATFTMVLVETSCAKRSTPGSPITLRRASISVNDRFACSANPRAVAPKSPWREEVFGGGCGPGEWRCSWLLARSLAASTLRTP